MVSWGLAHCDAVKLADFYSIKPKWFIIQEGRGVSLMHNSVA